MAAKKKCGLNEDSDGIQKVCPTTHPLTQSPFSVGHFGYLFTNLGDRLCPKYSYVHVPFNLLQKKSTFMSCECVYICLLSGIECPLRKHTYSNT